jgi:hypothetical protein
MMTHFMLEGTVHEGLLDTLNTIERSMLDRFDVLLLTAARQGKGKCPARSPIASLPRSTHPSQ